jgi:hypothetical protein
MNRRMIKMLTLFCLLLVACDKNIGKKCIDPEAENLIASEVQTWLDKNDIQVPSDLASQLDIPEYVIQILKSAKEGTDMSIVSYKVTKDFIQEIQHVAGYYFENGVQTTIVKCN